MDPRKEKENFTLIYLLNSCLWGEILKPDSSDEHINFHI